MGPKGAVSARGRATSKSPTPVSREKSADSKKGAASRSKSPGTSKKDKSDDKKKSPGVKNKGKVVETNKVTDEGKKASESSVESEAKEPEEKKEESKEEPVKEVAPSPDAKVKEDSPGKPKKKRKVPMSMPAGGLSGKIFVQAIIDNDADLLEFYLDHGPLADDIINFQNNSKMTPLMMATQKKKILSA